MYERMSTRPVKFGLHFIVFGNEMYAILGKAPVITGFCPFFMFQSKAARPLIEETLRIQELTKIPQYREDLVQICLAENKFLNENQKLGLTTNARLSLIERNEDCLLAYQNCRIYRLIEMHWKYGASIWS